MKWADADLVRYHIVGVYQGRADVAAGSDVAYADVTDRVTIDLTWKQSEAALVGTPAIVNEKSVVTNPRNYDAKCAPPTLKGDYEHYTVLSAKDGLGAILELQVQTTYPAVDVVQFCTGSKKAVAGKVETQAIPLPVVSPMMFALPLTGNEGVTISADRKSLIVKKDGWTWTYTPTPGK